MKKIVTLLLTLVFGLNGYAQNSFVKGYYIDNSNQKVECLVKNDDWLNNPTEFKYKLLEDSEIKTSTIDSVKEFGILNVSKYVRYSVDIDRSSALIDEMGYDKNSTFNKETLFLKVLIEGKATLYSYEDKGLIRYFFNKDGDDVEQLIYKNYLTDEGQVAKNNLFRGQLWNTLKCPSISMGEISKLSYKQSELVKLFVNYNKCSNSEFLNYKIKQKKDLFNLTLRPGVRISSLVLGNDFYHWKEIDFGKGLASFRFGLEAEFIMGFNNNKWAILLEPTYQQFKSEANYIPSEEFVQGLVANVDYSSIEVNLGLRYYIFINDNLKFFANPILIYDNSFNSSIELTRPDGELVNLLDINAGVSGAIGLGFKYHERYSLELRYLPSRNILKSYGAWDTKLNSFSMILGYSMF